MTLPSASWPNERPLDPRGDGEAASGQPTPPAGAVSLADLIADSGPLPADAALECVQRIAERISSAAPPLRTDFSPTDVLVDDDGGVWIRECSERGRVDLDGSTSRPLGMDRLGRLLAFVATGDGAHLADSAVIDPATLPPPLSTVAGRLFSRNGACYRSYDDVARDAADLRLVETDLGAESETASTHVTETAPGASNVPSRLVSVADESATETATPTEETAAESDGSRFALAMLIVMLLSAGVAFVAWQLL